MTPSGVKIDAFEIPDDLIDHSVPVLRTAEGIEFVRTPDERFEGLEGYPFAPHYLEIDGLRVHYVDEGPADGPLVVLMHGQPTWSYLYRTMIPLLVDAGMRVVAWDNIGFGRSDKPIDPMIHTYVHHVTWFHQIIERLDLVDITLFCQDWGGVIGLRVVAEDPDRFVRVVAANTGLIEASALSTGGEPPITLPSIAVMGTERRGFIEAASADDPTSMNFRDGFQWWIDFALHAANFSVGEFVFATTRGKVSAEVMAGYDAPFPSFIYQMAPHAFPAMVPTIGDSNAAAWDALGRFDRPFLYLGGDFDTIGSRAVQERHTAHIPGAAGQDHERFAVGHFIQEEMGPVMVERILGFMAANRV